MFSLPKTTADLISVTNRAEMHGEEHAPAVSLHVHILGPNTMLDSFSPPGYLSMRNVFYQAVKGQKDVPGVPATTPQLRIDGIESVSSKIVLEGWTVIVDHGIDGESAVVLKKCKIDKVRIQPLEGGEVHLDLRIGTSAVDPRGMGLLAFKTGQEVSITIKPPKAGEVSDDKAVEKATKKQKAQEAAGQQRLDKPKAETPEEALARATPGGSA